MAFNTKYRISGTSDVYGKIDVLIKQDNFVGSVTEFSGVTRDFAVLKIGSGGEDISTSIVSSELQLQFYAESDFVALELAGSEYFDFLVEVRDDLNELIWTGWVDPDQFEEQYVNTPYVVTVVASDFLDGLKNVALGSLFGTKNDLWTVLRTALAGTQLELQYLESVSIYSNGMSQNDQDSPFTQAEVTNDTWTGKTCYDVLEAILKPFFARVYQYRGWRIENITEKRDNHVIRVFNSGGVYQGFVNSLSLKTLDNNPTSFSKFLNKSANTNFRPALNFSKAYFFSSQEKPNTSGLTGFDKLSDWVDTTNLVSWTKENGIVISRVVTEYNGSEYGVWIDGRNTSFSADQYIQSIAFPVDVNVNNNITVGFDYKMDYPSVIILGSKPILYFEVLLDAGTNQYWWNGTNWIEGTRKTLRISASPRNSWRNYEITIPVLPESGNIFFRIHKLVKSGTEGVTKLFLTRWKSNIKAQAEQADVYFFNEGTTPVKTSFRGPVFEHFISDGLILDSKGVLDVGGTLTANWKRKGVTESLPIRTLFVLQWLSMNQMPTAVLQGLLYQRGELIRPFDTIQDDPSVSTKRYIMSSWEVSLGSGKGNINYREIPQADVAGLVVREGTADSIESDEYLLRGGQPVRPRDLPTIDDDTPRIDLDATRAFNGDLTGDRSAVELTPSAILNKARLDITGLNSSQVLINAIKDSQDQEAMTNLRVSDLAGLTNHNDLAGKQGGQAGEYYHLNLADYNDLQSIVNPQTDPTNWVYGNIADTITATRGMAYGNGVYVAVGNFNKVFVSSDGINWTTHLPSTDLSWEDVTFGNGLFVAVASNGTTNRVMTSPDGINWTTRTTPNNSWFGVTFGNGLFVAVAVSGTGNRVMTSPDGINWTSRTSAQDSTWSAVTYGNGLFVAVSSLGGSNSAMTSPDGINWTSRVLSSYQYFDIEFGNGVFVAVGSVSSGLQMRIVYSSDGINWNTALDLSGTAQSVLLTTVTFGAGNFVARGFGTRDYYYSPNGIDWTFVDEVGSSPNTLEAMAFGNNKFVFLSSNGTYGYSDIVKILNHSQLNLDDGRNPHQTRYEDLLGTPPASDRNVDGGSANSVYLPSQNINGGTA